MRRTAVFVVAALLVASCGGGEVADTSSELPTTAVEAPTTTSSSTTTTLPPTTTTTLSVEELAAIQYEEDVKAIKALFRRYSDSWFGGEEVGFAYIEANNYPDEGCTAEEFAEGWQVVDGFQEELVVDDSTVERDDGWPIPGGRAAGIVPEGRIYIMSAEIIDTAPGYSPTVQAAEIHATVLNDGKAYFFFGCPVD